MPQVKLKRVPWNNDGPISESNSMAVMIDWLATGDNYNRWLSGDKKMVLQNE